MQGGGSKGFLSTALSRRRTADQDQFLTTMRTHKELFNVSMDFMERGPATGLLLPEGPPGQRLRWRGFLGFRG